VSIASQRQSGRGNLIQQLLNEMDDANQKIDHYSGSKKSGRGIITYCVLLK
jgi:hypothetical protein